MLSNDVIQNQECCIVDGFVAETVFQKFSKIKKKTIPNLLGNYNEMLMGKLTFCKTKNLHPVFFGIFIIFFFFVGVGRGGVIEVFKSSVFQMFINNISGLLYMHKKSNCDVNKDL